MKRFFWMILLALAACSTRPGSTSLPATGTPTAALTPYRAPSRTPAPPGATASPAPPPSPTPTPLVHVVKSGEDMFGIALRYGVSLEALKTANPDVNPRAMSVGATLVIPASQLPTPTVANPTPTAVPLFVGRPACFQQAEGGLFCLAAVRNDTSAALEAIAARIRIAGEDGLLREAEAALPLNLLAPGAELALSAAFPPPAPQRFSSGAELITALSVADGDARYLPARLEEVRVEIAPDGLSARFSGRVTLPSGGTDARGVWVAAAAFDAQGDPVGLRRWESTAPLPSGAGLAFSFEVYSLGAPIARVAGAVEARP